MSEIEIGEYIRTTDGEIEKVVLIYDNRYMNEDGNMTHFDEIKAHSKNIEDLIEADDYVNGCKVYENKQTCLIVYQKVYNSEVDYNYINYDEIKEILTHELYEQNSYKVVE